MVLVVAGERHESLQIILPRNEVAGCLSVIARRVGIAKVRCDIKVFLYVADSMHLIHVQLGTLGQREVHKLDGFPHGVVMQLL